MFPVDPNSPHGHSRAEQLRRAVADQIEAAADIASARKIRKAATDRCVTIPHHAGGTTIVLADDDPLEIARKELGL